MDFSLRLSTRPEKFLGDIETWKSAEEKLTQALNNFSSKTGKGWELNPGDGAFYGPKIDIEISDALRRSFQCATMQLDFQLPEAFALEFMTHEKAAKAKEETSSDTNGPAKAKGGGSEANLSAKAKGPGPGRARPVMLHRAIVGSFERFMAILIEHFAGKWPFWLSPRQVLVVPVMPALNDYVEEVQAKLRQRQLYADVDISGQTLPKKILRGQHQQYNFVFGKLG